MKRVLLTGATGFIGRHTIDPLIVNNFEIHAPTIDRSQSHASDITWHDCNLLVPNQIKELIDYIRPSHLLHFAWYTTHGKYWTAPENLHWVNASLSLLEQFNLSGGKRAVVAGTCAEYCWQNGLCNETVTPLNPSTLYGTSKASLYHILSSYAALQKLSLAWGRIFFLYGNHEPQERLIPTVITKLLVNENVQCSSGEQIRDFMHVQDVADAFVTLLDSDVPGPINIASGDAIPLKEIIQTISSKIRSTGSIQFGAIPNNSLDPPSITADVSRLKNELQWKPSITLESGIDNAIDWWSQQLVNA